MAHIEVTKGLDIPIEGEPSGDIQTLTPPSQAALDLHAFDMMRFKVLTKPGEMVKRGQPLCFDKATPERMFVSPVSGKVNQLRRGLKRRLLDIVIDVDGKDEVVDHGKVNIASASREEILAHLLKGGMFAHIWQRPFHILAQPNREPRSIFVKAVETAPFAVPAEMRVKGHEEDFQAGLNALDKLTKGPVHLVHAKGSLCTAFTKAENVQIHTVSGSHPAGNASVHIHHIDPIQSADDVVWTVGVDAVVAIGHLLNTGHYYNERIISIAGTGISPEHRGYFRGVLGHPIGALLAGRNAKGSLRLISGDVLMGQKTVIDSYLHHQHTTLTVIPEETEREMLHFFRFGGHKYTFSRTYLSGHLPKGSREYNFTTSNHGEHRGFVEPSIYQKVMPMQIPVMYLVKAIQGNDMERAEELGLLEVAPEDFALPTFICPSKQEMVAIVEDALKNSALENVH